MMAEENIYNALDDELTFAGIQFDEMERRVQLRAEPLGKIETDLDVLMRNGEALAIIEVKHRVEKSDINELLNDKLEKVKKFYPKHKNYKILLGIGGMCFEDGVEDEAKKNGIGIIKVVGEKVEYFTENITTY
jgi:LDH2 family malate/lactate/ureidoglycolate dehydrogenase